MLKSKKVTRREFFQGVTGTLASYIGVTSRISQASTSKIKSKILLIDKCRIHDGMLSHKGVDSLLNLMSENELPLYRTLKSHPWGGQVGIIAPNDVVLIKVNSQWKCRGATNTDVVRGLIHRILEHPEGFSGEIVIFENGQMQGSFDGNPIAFGRYKNFPECSGIRVNSEDETLTVDRLVNEIFRDAPVSSFLLDPVSNVFIADDDHSTNGYRKMFDAKISYPCFTTAGGHRIEMSEGIWNGEGYDKNVKLINIPVLKTHSGSGITGVLKNSYGILSMKDDENWRKIRHYDESGSQCGKIYSLVRMPDLNIVDAIWATYQGHHRGYPPESTHRANILLAGFDPVALDYYGSKHILLPLGGDRTEEHNPESFHGLKNHLSGAQEIINRNGGIRGIPAQQGDDNITVISRSAKS